MKTKNKQNIIAAALFCSLAFTRERNVSDGRLSWLANTFRSYGAYEISGREEL